MTGMLMEISLNDLYVDPCSCAKCLFVKQIRQKIYNFVLMSTTYLWLHNRKIFILTARSVRPRPYDRDYTISKFEQSRCDDSGVTMHIQEKMTHLKG